jgi:hypothetical protein
VRDMKHFLYTKSFQSKNLEDFGFMLEYILLKTIIIIIKLDNVDI